MAKRKVTCGRCGRERYEDRMVQGQMATRYDDLGTPVAWKNISYWECSGRATCRTARKERNRRQRQTEQDM